MKALEATNLVICVRNEGHELDLERWGVYEAIPYESLVANGIRVVDETGEDYIYPTNYFASAEYLKRRRPWVTWGAVGDGTEPRAVAREDGEVRVQR